MNIVQLKDGTGSKVYAVSHTDAIKVSGELKTLTTLLSDSVDMYNVTEHVPLDANEYYELSTAIGAVPTDIRKPGLVITFESSELIWDTWLFIENYENYDPLHFVNTQYWKLFSSVDANNISFDNSNTDLTSLNLQDVVSEIAENTPKIYSITDADLDIADEEMNVLVRFDNGHIQTKNFNSANIAKIIEINNDKFLTFD